MPNDPTEDTIPILPENVPVMMPELPVKLLLTTPQQYKAMGDEVRVRITHAIQFQPMTAKQLADMLHVAPGSIGHHLQVLEEAGLIQVVARRQVRNAIAKYYTRTAQLYIFAPPDTESVTAEDPLDYLTNARNVLLETALEEPATRTFGMGSPRARLNASRIQAYHDRLLELVHDFAQEPPDPEGIVVVLNFAFFQDPTQLPPLAPQAGGDTPTDFPTKNEQR